jgi:hypothetical protein
VAVCRAPALRGLAGGTRIIMTAAGQTGSMNASTATGSCG